MKASELSGKVTKLETLIRFYGYLYDRLKYLRPSVNSLIEQAVCSHEFDGLKFLPYCLEEMKQGKGFSESWNLSVHKDKSVFSDDISQIICSISDTLGTVDLESQLSEIAYDKSRLEHRLIEVRDYAEKHRKLYQTLGVLSGLGLAVLVA